MSANPVARYKNTLIAAYNWYIKENGLEIMGPFAGLLIKGVGSSKVDRLLLQDAHIQPLEPAMKDGELAWAFYVLLRDTGARVAEIAGLRVQDCDTTKRCLTITPTPWRRLKNKTSERSVPPSLEVATLLKDLIKGKEGEEPVFERYAKDRGMANCSQMLIKRLGQS